MGDSSKCALLLNIVLCVAYDEQMPREHSENTMDNNDSFHPKNMKTSPGKSG